jgi:RNA polymerase sigma factor (sigma-70 family)
MAEALDIRRMAAQQDLEISSTVERERGRLRNFIRRWIPNEADAEDILQEVFYELVSAVRFTEPIEQIGAWLFQVARNRIIDRFRKNKRRPIAKSEIEDRETGERFSLEDLLPSPDLGPDAAYARSLLTEELADALEELPEEQREVFVEHEIEGRSFKEIAADTGVSVNTLLSRKHYAVLYLRERLQTIYEEFQKGW